MMNETTREMMILVTGLLLMIVSPAVGLGVEMVAPIWMAAMAGVGSAVVGVVLLLLAYVESGGKSPEATE